VDYIGGRFDSDCNVHGHGVELFGAISQLRIMEFERHLRMRLGMRVGKIRPYGKPGETTFVGSKRIVSRKQKITFYVNAQDFLKSVRYLNIEWRNQELQSAFGGRQWTARSQEIRARAIDYKSFGCSCKEVVGALQREYRAKIPYSTVYSWKSGKTLSWEEHAKQKALTLQ
jgi:hypothetical protein